MERSWPTRSTSGLVVIVEVTLKSPTPNNTAPLVTDLMAF